MCLINNAGIGYMAVVEDLRLEDLRRQFETNLFGVLRVTQAVLPHMRERKKGAHPDDEVAWAGLVAPPTYGAYSSSKFALEGLSNALRLELYPFGIKVILIEPGYIVTSFQQIAKDLARTMWKRRPKGLTPKFILPHGKARTKAGSAPRPLPKIALESCSKRLKRPIQRLAIRSRPWPNGLRSENGFCRTR